MKTYKIQIVIIAAAVALGAVFLARPSQSTPKIAPSKPSIIDKTAPQLSPQSLLKITASPASLPQERSEALYELTQNMPASALEVAKVAAAPLPKFRNLNNPHSADSMDRTQELSLRVRALEALDLHADDPAVARLIAQVAEELSEPSLQLLARLSLAGIQEGRPGKASRMIDRMLKGESR